MRFNPEKCQVIHVCTKTANRKKRPYTLHGHVLEEVDCSKYLGVHITNDLSWHTHSTKTAAKASRTLGFLRRNLYSCTRTVRERTYNALVLPGLQYAASAWDPYLVTDIDELEKVQRRGARFVTNNYQDRTPGCVSGMIQELKWPPLHERRRLHRLSFLFKIKHQLVDVNPGSLLQSSDSRTRGKARIHQAHTQSTVYSNSFYPRTIREWNLLPTTITDITAQGEFERALAAHSMSSASVFLA